MTNSEEVEELAQLLRDRDYSRTPSEHLARFILNEGYRKTRADKESK